MSEHKTVAFSLEKMDAQEGTFQGYASTFGNLDLVGDVIHPGAFTKTLAERGGKVRLLWQHDTTEPIGKPLELREDAKGLYIKAKVSDTSRGRDALALLRDGAIDSMSIGYDVIPSGVDFSKGSDGKTVRNLRELKLYEVSLVSFPANEQATVLSVKGAVPVHTPKKAPEGEAWSKPTLRDFTDQQWEDLSEAERRRIAGHYAYYSDLDTFGSLHLPHHRPSDGAVVWAGVANCAARMNQVLGLGDLAGVKAHLAAHYRQFDKPVPWESQGKAYRADLSLLSQPVDLKGLWETRWQAQKGFDDSLESILADEQLEGAGKLRLIEESCQQYSQAISGWAARAIAIGGKAAPEPAEVKAGRRLSQRSRDSIQAAISALQELLGEDVVAATEEETACNRRRDDEKSAPAPAEQAATDSDSADKAGPGTEPPTAQETKAAGPDVTPPTSEFERQSTALAAELDAFERQLEGITL